MLGESKGSERDQALIGVLERLAGEMQRQDVLLDDILKRQIELSRLLEAAELQFRSRQNDMEKTVEKSNDRLYDAVNQYRSNMLNLVSEQDRINDNIDGFQEVVKTMAFTLDTTNKKFNDLDERLKMLERASGDHFGMAIKQPEILRAALSDTSRSFTKLHADTEKNLKEFQNGTTRQLDNFQHDILRRLLLLDGIITSLQTLLSRTEPPEKRPLLIKRQLERLLRFLRNKFSILFKRKPK